MTTGASVYKVTNLINNKVYIGVAKNFNSRKSSHVCEAFTRKNKKYPFYGALSKYGINNFTWEIVHEDNDWSNAMNVMEEHFIRKFNSHYVDGHGYNMTYGGKGTKGYKPTDETKTNISKALKGKPAWNKGKKCEYTSERNRKNRGIKRPHTWKEYKMTSPDGKEFVIKGLKSFCEENGLHIGNVCSVAHGRLNHYKGWRCEMVGKY